MNRTKRVTMVQVLWLLSVAPVCAGDFYVITATFPSQGAAQSEAALRGGWVLDTDFYKHAGKPRLGGNLGSPALRPQLLVALLCELSVEVAEHAGGEDPCEPQEPYQEVRISFVDLSRTMDDGSSKAREEAKRRDVDVGAFRIIKRTGEI